MMDPTTKALLTVALEPHRPVLTITGDSVASARIACTCGPTDGRPFMWHVADVLEAAFGADAADPTPSTDAEACTCNSKDLSFADAHATACPLYLALRSTPPTTDAEEARDHD